MMRQYELVERVSATIPNADEALLNRAYVYAMQTHGPQKRASGDPYFAHPLEVAAILTDLQLDDATIAAARAARHDRGHRGDARGDRRAVRPGDRRAGRGPDQDQEARPRLQEGRAGARTSASSCWPSPRTCACCWSSSPTGCTTCARSHYMPAGQARAHRRGDARHLCAARRPHGHAGDARGAGGPRLPPSQPGGLRARSPRGWTRSASEERRVDRRDRAAS